jgi:hypothetical protein
MDAFQKLPAFHFHGGCVRVVFIPAKLADSNALLNVADFF